MSLAAWTWSCLRPYRGRVAILTTIAVTNVALGVLAPWPLKLVVDNVLEGRPLPGALDRIGVALAGDSRAGLLVLVVCAGLLLQVLTQTLSMINVQVQVDTGSGSSTHCARGCWRTCRRWRSDTMSSLVRPTRSTAWKLTPTACTTW